MFEVVTESDLTIFVCPCGSQFGEEINIYHHIRQLHHDLVFVPGQGMITRYMSFPSAKMADFGDISNRQANLLGSEVTQLIRLRKLFCFKHELPRI